MSHSIIQSTAAGDRSHTAPPKITLLFDGACPYCRIEAKFLGRRNRDGQLAFEDISDPAFDAGRYGLTASEVSAQMCGVLPDGRIVRGVEAFRHAYRAIGLGWLLAPTNWPILRPICNWLYALFARHRVALGRPFGRKCDDETCARP